MIQLSFHRSLRIADRDRPASSARAAALDERRLPSRKVPSTAQEENSSAMVRAAMRGSISA
jgi:hypothetical protein